MGLFSYICPCCNKNIRYGEKVHLRHIRHGKLLGETEGTYNGYGGVEEDNVYRAWKSRCDTINCHEELCKSEFGFMDSVDYNAKIYKGTPLQWMEYRETKVSEGMSDLCNTMYEEWSSLKKYKVKKVLSGISAYHKYCYNRISDEEKEKFVISKNDREQGCGPARKKYS